MDSSTKNEILDILGKNLPGVIFYRFIREHDGTTTFDYISENVKLFTGHTSEEVISNPTLLLSTALPKYHDYIQQKKEESFNNLSIFDIEIECQSAYNGIRWVKIISTPEKLQEGRVAWFGIQSDITESKEAELKLNKYNHELKLLNNINDILSNTHDEHAIYELICNCLVTKGGYKLAWICHIPKPNSKQIVEPVCAYGEIDYLKNIQIDLSDEKMRKGPTGKVLLRGGKFVNNDVESNPNFKPWLKKALQFDIRSSIVLELEILKDRRSIINIYSSNKNAFDENEVQILERIARNVSTAIKNIHIELEKRDTSYLLSERVKEIKTLYQINNLLQDSSTPYEEILQKVVNIIPNGWQYVNYCVARIIFNEHTYCSKGFEETNWFQTAIIESKYLGIGKLEVYYLHNMKLSDEGPFLKEERDLLNTIAEMIGSFYDKNRTQHQLITSEANLKSIFDHTEVGYLLIDLDYTIISCNSKIIEGYLGETKVQAEVGLNFLSIINENRKDFIRSVLENVINKVSPYEYDFNYTNSNGTKFYTIMAVPISNKDKIIGVCISAYDTTKRKKEEVEREKITSELIQRNRDLEQFAYIVSHNLRAPVANILGLNSLLIDNPTEKEKNDIINKLNISTLRLDTVIRDLNSILQVRREISELKVEIDLEILIKHVKESISSLIATQKVEFQLDFTKVRKIKSIRTYLGSIFYNLITNSIKYARINTPIKIQISTDLIDNHIIIHYKDNCQGMDLVKYGEEVFGLYKKFNTTVEGKGIGLFMVKTQVEVMGGKIEVNSELNQGTEFIITFPSN